jgi:very-short-patch-repair endonuclease
MHAEAALWVLLKSKGVAGAKFRRQHSIQNYIADFYCPEVKLVVELDGSFHDRPGGKEYDRIRDETFRSLSLTVMRIPNDDVLRNIRAAAASIASKVEELRGKRTTPPAAPLLAKEGNADCT